MAANDRQEGGDHYRRSGVPQQHWDLVSAYGWDYFQGQITKYLMRWKDKHTTEEKRIGDLKKARHFLDKYIEEAERFGSNSFPVLRPEEQKARHGLTLKDLADGQGYDVMLLRKPEDVNNVAPTGFIGWTYEGGNSVDDFFRCKGCKQHLIIVKGTNPNASHSCDRLEAILASAMPSVVAAVVVEEGAPTRAYVDQGD